MAGIHATRVQALALTTAINIGHIQNALAFSRHRVKNLEEYFMLGVNYKQFNIIGKEAKNKVFKNESLLL